MTRGGTVSGDQFSEILFRPGGRLSVGHPLADSEGILRGHRGSRRSIWVTSSLGPKVLIKGFCMENTEINLQVYKQ